MNKAENRNLNHALEYASKGIPVFPLHTPTKDSSCSCGKPKCDSVGKHPRTKNGLKDATTDKKQIREWWGKWPNANIGIPTGSQSGFIVLAVKDK